MFKCKDCGKCFDINPTYCDCGNNEFEEIKNEEKHTLNIQQNIQPQIKEKKEPSIQIDYLSWGFFLFCIILSILAIMFLWNPKPQEEQPKTFQNEIVSNNLDKNININNLWIENKIKPSTTVAQKPKTEIQKPQQIINKTANTNKVQTRPTINKNVTTQTKKTTTTQNSQTKTVQKSIQKTDNKKASTQTSKTQITPPIDVQKYIPKPTTNTNTNVSTNTNVNKISTQPKQESKPTTSKVDTAAQQKELQNYKISLRNKIASNIDFASVVGDGNCAVTFKINQSGSLTNRNFSIQSPNNTLNDVVYNAMMQNPSYKKPPTGYKNETLTLTVKIYSGNFEVELR